MQQTEQTKALHLKRVAPIREVCQHCCNTGLVIREMVFRACICEAGRVAARNPASAVGRAIVPEDYTAVLA